MTKDYQIDHDAVEILNDLPQYRGPYRVLAEDVHLKASEVCESLRQTCPMAGLISTAMRSRSLEDRHWHD